MDRVLAPIIRRMSRATVALCNVKGSHLPIPGGSAVLLRIDTRRYLVTASHVFDAMVEGRTLAAIFGSEFIDVASRRRWRTKVGSGDENDRTDLAIVELNALDKKTLSEVTFLELSDIDPFGHVEERAVSTAFLGVGFPRSKQPRSLEGTQYRALSYSFVSHREAIWRDNVIGADPVRHIAIGYDRLGFEGIERTSQMPKPEGCSGGGLWRVPDATTSHNPEPKLVGIMMENYSRPYDVILASRIWNVLGGLGGIAAANQEVIDLMFPRIEERVGDFHES